MLNKQKKFQYPFEQCRTICVQVVGSEPICYPLRLFIAKFVALTKIICSPFFFVGPKSELIRFQLFGCQSRTPSKLVASIEANKKLAMSECYQNYQNRYVSNQLTGVVVVYCG